jgi:carbonic anhydrase/acetyltransferase-like protein (isoleucine patch superfamily)
VLELLTPFVHGLHVVCRGTASRVRNVYFRLLGVNLTGYVWMRSISIPTMWADITIEAGVSLDRGVVLLCGGSRKKNKLVLRHGTYVNRYTIFDAHEHLEIGPNCMIGPHCYITDADHGKTRGVPVQSQPMAPRPVVIEDEVWLGAGVIILPGIRIGKGAVIGAGSVVTKDVPANAIAVGMPAQVRRFRGDNRTRPE